MAPEWGQASRPKNAMPCGVGAEGRVSSVPRLYRMNTKQDRARPIPAAASPTGPSTRWRSTCTVTSA